MTRRLPFPHGVADPDRRQRLLLAILRDEGWFSVSWLDAMRTGRTGLRWREKISGEVSLDDWTDLEGGAAVQAPPLLVALGGSFHDPEDTWDVPFRATTEAIEVPDSASPIAVRHLNARVAELASGL